MQENKKVFVSKILSIVGAVFGLAIVVSLIIGGSLLSSRKWDPEWNPFRPKAEKRI